MKIDCAKCVEYEECQKQLTWYMSDLKKLGITDFEFKVKGCKAFQDKFKLRKKKPRGYGGGGIRG